MNKPLFAHLIEIQSITISLDELDLDSQQRLDLAHLVDTSMHKKIIDTVLSQLNDQDKQQFLSLLAESAHDKIWKLLNEKVDNIEDKIKVVANELKEDLKKDIKEATGKKE